jgi:predicted RNase H-like nuclease (RuvC/YqgF family)
MEVWTLKNKTFVVDKDGREFELVAKVIKEEYIVKGKDGRLATLDESSVEDVKEKRIPDEPKKNKVKTKVSVSSKKRDMDPFEKRVERLEQAVMNIMDRFDEMWKILD